MGNETAGGGERLKAGAVSLFRYLRELVGLRSRTIFDTDEYVAGEPPGHVLWLHTIPVEDEVTSSLRLGTASPTDPLLEIQRVPRLEPPELPDLLQGWLSERDVRDPHGELAEPSRKYVGGTNEHDDSSLDPDEQSDPRFELIEDHPEVAAAFRAYSTGWIEWASEVRRRERIQDAYNSLFRIEERVRAFPEVYECVLGVGCMSWSPADASRIRRHLVWIPVAIRLDESSGTLTVAPADDLPYYDFDVLPAPDRPARDEAGQFEEWLHTGEVVGDAEGLHDILRRVAHSLYADAEYSEDEEPKRPGSSPVIALAPALVLRRRSNRTLIEVLDKVIEELDAMGEEIPSGIAELVSHEVAMAQGSRLEEGASQTALTVIDRVGPLLPLWSNREQELVVSRFEQRARVLVQGPPGTGKTTTIANLICHLLATGRRVLVTAQTEQALRELKAKLPAEIQALCVSVLGATADELNDLRAAATAIVDRVSRFQPERHESRVAELLEEWKASRARETSAVSGIVAARRRETDPITLGGIHGTPSEIAAHVRERQELLGWIEDYLEAPLSEEPVLTSEEARELVGLVESADPGDETRAVAASGLPDPSLLPDPKAFAALIQREERAREVALRFDEIRSSELYQIAHDRLGSLGSGVREGLLNDVVDLDKRIDRLLHRSADWVGPALKDAFRSTTVWEGRYQRAVSLLEDAAEPLARLGRVSIRIDLPEESWGELYRQAEELSQHLAAGGKLTRLFGTPRPVRQAQQFLESVRIDGRSPSDAGDAGLALAYFEGRRLLSRAVLEWPEHAALPVEDTLHEWRELLDGEARALGDVLGVVERAQVVDAELDDLAGIHVTHWEDDTWRDALRLVIEASTASTEFASETLPLDELAISLTAARDRAEAPDPLADELVQAVTERSESRYERALLERQRLAAISESVARRDALLQRLGAATPRLAAELANHAGETRDRAVTRLRQFGDAWRWKIAASGIADLAQSDEEARATRDLERAEADVRRILAAIVAELAWAHCVNRMDRPQQAALQEYVTKMRDLGKEKGRRDIVARKRQQARDALARARTAVPAWVMPVTRITNTVKIERDAFDVVIVDEASQVGVDSLWLHWLAPSVIVVGDEYQTSPSAPGLQDDEVDALRRRFLEGMVDSPGVLEPTHSLYTNAQVRYGAPIRLREHYRCVQQIIDFSNHYVYAPTGAPLIPMRPPSTSLNPLELRRVEDGFRQGTSGRQFNPREADAVVEQIEKCLADPAYDGLKFGVIALTGGKAQARYIHDRLVERIEPRVWRERDLACGDSARFQGAERDVMFLSMVIGADGFPPKLGHESYMREFNVAASRAKEQMWLFHSVPRENLNSECPRALLLDHFLKEMGVETEATSDRVSETQLDDRFDSLLEQRVYNRIVSRGYRVIPQLRVEPENPRSKRIDLVVLANGGRLAVECDGDQWHGEDREEEDVLRQRALERSGWKFWRIRGSAFYADPEGSLEPLWDRLAELDEIGRVRLSGSGNGAPAARSSIDAIDVQTPPAGGGAAGPITLDESVGTPLLDVAAPAEVVQPEREKYERRPDSQDDHSLPVERGQPRQKIGPVSRERSRVPPLREYHTWSLRQLPHVNEAKLRSVIDGLVEIVAAEGPIMADRAYRLYHAASGGQRIRKPALRIFNRAAAEAIRRERLRQVDDGVSGQRGRTLYVPGQEPIVLRERGPRDLYEVPRTEIAALIDALGLGTASAAQMVDAILDALDHRKTSKARAYIDECVAYWRQARDSARDDVTSPPDLADEEALPAPPEHRPQEPTATPEAAGVSGSDRGLDSPGGSPTDECRHGLLIQTCAICKRT